MITQQPGFISVVAARPATILLVVEVAIIAAVLSAPAHTSSTIRLTVLVPLLGCLYGISQTASQELPLALAGLVGGTAGFCFCHYLDVALIRWPLPIIIREMEKPRHKTKPATSRSSSDVSLRYRLERGISSLSSFRKANTCFEVKNVPRFPENSPPNTVAFLRSSASSALAGVLVLNLASLAPPPPPGAAPFSAEKVPLFRPIWRGAITAEDITTRCVGCLAHWLLTYALLRGCYDACSFALVASRITAPASWRPLFGPLAHMFTLRGFWGGTWHQLTRDPCGQPATFLTYAALGRPKAGTANAMSRYLRLFLTFTLSGLVHGLADLAAGIPFQASGSLGFFLMQAVGIVIEDTVRTAWGDVRLTDLSQPRRSGYKLVGYVWVALWFFWTTPMWFYPSARQHDGSPVLPFSIFGLFAGKSL